MFRCSRVVCPYAVSRCNRAILRLAAVVLLTTSAHATAATPVDQTKDAKLSGSTACAPISLDFHESADVDAFRNYDYAIAGLLEQENFTQLDCIADQARLQKERFSGGVWKIGEIYTSLEKPQPGVHATQEDWNNHIARLKRWVAARPDSVTGRIALAEASVTYAWDARGEGYSNTVSDSGWKLFYQRLEEAKSILNEAAQLKTKCPEWYVVMQQIALGEGWQVESARGLFERAVAFEPQYQSYYRLFAWFMLPRWYGEAGDASRFAQEVADKVGGPQGDVLYYWIAAKVACACDEPELLRFSFPRIQKGFEQLEKDYGPSMTGLNQLALIAVKAGDLVAADAAFKRIGDTWDQETWKTHKYFEQNKSYAEQLAPFEQRKRTGSEEAAKNGQTPEGAYYGKKIDDQFVPYMRQCSQGAANDSKKFGFVIQISEKGDLQYADADSLPTELSQCLLKAVWMVKMDKGAPFPPPPHPAYWLQVHLDPGASYTAAH